MCLVLNPELKNRSGHPGLFVHRPRIYWRRQLREFVAWSCLQYKLVFVVGDEVIVVVESGGSGPRTARIESGALQGLLGPFAQICVGVKGCPDIDRCEK